MRYQKIESQIWHDEKFIKLSHSQQLLFFYILTSPHNNLLGTYVLKMGYITEDLKLKSVKNDLNKLIKIGLIKYDFYTGLIHIPNFLKHNQLTNPNQHKSAVKVWNRLPKSSLLLDVYEGLGEGLKQRLGKGLLKPETEEEEEIEEEIEINNDLKFPDWLPKNEWNSFLKMRKSIKKPLTNDAMELAIKKLDKLRKEGNDPKEVLNQSIFSSWQGLFPLKEHANNQSGPQYKEI